MVCICSFDHRNFNLSFRRTLIYSYSYYICSGSNWICLGSFSAIQSVRIDILSQLSLKFHIYLPFLSFYQHLADAINALCEYIQEAKKFRHIAKYVRGYYASMPGMYLFVYLITYPLR